MSSRILLEAEHPEVFKQEVRTAFGMVKTARLYAVNSGNENNTITDIPITSDCTVHIRSIVIARQTGGTTGTVGTSGSWELVGTYTDTGGVLTLTDSTTLITDQCSESWAILYEIYQNRLYLQGVLPGPGYGTNRNILWNAYIYLHILSES